MKETQKFKTIRNKILRIEMSIHKNLNEQLIISKLMLGSRRVLDDIEMTIVKNEKTIMN